jgi:hypothetical protein
MSCTTEMINGIPFAVVNIKKKFLEVSEEESTALTVGSNKY